MANTVTADYIRNLRIDDVPSLNKGEIYAILDSGLTIGPKKKTALEERLRVLQLAGNAEQTQASVLKSRDPSTPASIETKEQKELREALEALEKEKVENATKEAEANAAAEKKRIEDEKLANEAASALQAQEEQDRLDREKQALEKKERDAAAEKQRLKNLSSATEILAKKQATRSQIQSLQLTPQQIKQKKEDVEAKAETLRSSFSSPAPRFTRSKSAIAPAPRVANKDDYLDQSAISARVDSLELLNAQEAKLNADKLEAEAIKQGKSINNTSKAQRQKIARSEIDAENEENKKDRLFGLKSEFAGNVNQIKIRKKVNDFRSSCVYGEDPAYNEHCAGSTVRVLPTKTGCVNRACYCPKTRRAVLPNIFPYGDYYKRSLYNYPKEFNPAMDIMKQAMKNYLLDKPVQTLPEKQREKEIQSAANMKAFRDKYPFTNESDIDDAFLATCYQDFLDVEVAYLICFRHTTFIPYDFAMELSEIPGTVDLLLTIVYNLASKDDVEIDIIAEIETLLSNLNDIEKQIVDSAREKIWEELHNLQNAPKRNKNKILGQLRDNLRDWLSGDMEQTSKHYPAANMINADPYGDAYAAEKLVP